MGNRISEGVCVFCEGPIIEPNEWYCCSQCVPKIRAQILQRIRNPGQRKKGTLIPKKIRRK